MSKIQIWKQFSTMLTYICFWPTSVLQCQRYKFESNSQPLASSTRSIRCRFYNVKDTNLKAILNTSIQRMYGTTVGFTMSKIQIWKQFSTLLNCVNFEVQSVLQCQRYKFESNSQQTAISYVSRSESVLQCQRYKFESNSQHRLFV